MLAMTQRGRGRAAAAAYYSAPRVRRSSIRATDADRAWRGVSPRAAAAQDGAQHRDLLRRPRAIARRGPDPRDRGRELLRHECRRVRLHARVPDPEPDPRAG